MSEHYTSGDAAMKEMRLIYRILFYTVYILLGWTVRILYPLRVFGRENLVDGGFVLAPNHLSAVDPLYVILARGLKKRMLVMGKDELFHLGRFVNFCWKIFGVFPVDRGTGNKETVEQAVRQVRRGCGLLVFPEGTRSKTGELGRLKSGAFVVAMQAGVPVIPCLVYYSAGRPKLFRRVTVAFGPPVSLRAMGLEGDYSAKKLRGAKSFFAGVLGEMKDRYVNCAAPLGGG